MPARIVPKDAAGAETSEDWLRRMDEIGEDEGYFERLGGVHWSFFADHGTTLLVTFERLHDIRTGSPGQMPFGYGVAVPQGWSHLCLVAGQDRWYRDPTVFRYFDRLVDDAFFEDFDRVVFYGAGMGGYAAAAFSVVAPGATVILAAPQATLDPLYAVWDPRFRSAR
ncbi:MAG: phosphoadenosine phosphosulfate reductase, partial [Rhodobacteraceae bacterium]|nr:phosphoadenosine phosphosulfate reductase [Paracoccaceae bacterium]